MAVVRAISQALSLPRKEVRYDNNHSMHAGVIT